MAPSVRFTIAQIDNGAGFCHAANVIRPIRQFVAVLLAIWLPLFSGNALAASVAMQSTRGDCHPVAAQVALQSHEHHMHHDATTPPLHIDQLDASQDQSAGQHDPQDSSCKDCGVCHFACSGFLANAAIEITEAGFSTQVYAASSTPFQSFTSAPLDPPPLSRV